MPKKKFESSEDAQYDPFAAENKRAAIRAAVGAAPDRSSATKESVVTLAPEPPVEDAKAPQSVPKPLAEKVEVSPKPVTVPTLEKTSSKEAAVSGRAAQHQTVQKRFRVTEDEEAEFEAFVLRLRKAAASKVDFSVVSRSLWSVIQHAESQVLEELKRRDIPKRPGKHNAIGLAEYEELWVHIISQALRKMPPVR